MAAEVTFGLGAILLAAGGSTRLGRPKQLLEVDGMPLVVRQSRLLLEVGPACLVVVTGKVEGEVESALAGLDLRCQVNPAWQAGMGTSLACGVSAMPERVRAALVLLCDQWKVTGDDLRRLVGTWAENPQAAVVADHGDATGPPAILPRGMFDRLSRLQGNTGARRVLKNWKGEIRPIPMPNAAFDIDAPGDLSGL